MHQLKIKVKYIQSVPQESRENILRRLQCTSRERRHFKPTNGNESLHEINNDNGIREVRFTT